MIRQGRELAVSRSGLTLIELLTSTAIGLVMAVLATIAFLQVRSVLQRMQVRIEMHNSARFLQQTLAEQLSALQQDAALWVETVQDDGTANGTVSLTFLKGKTDEHDYNSTNGDHIGGEEFGVYMTRCCDLGWCGWRWDQRRSTLSMGFSKPPHQFRINASWNGPNGDYGFGNPTFMNMPQPLRQAIPYPGVPITVAALGSSKAALSGNRYGSPDVVSDLSDYQDLMNQMAPVLRNVTGFVVELVLADGSVVDADNTQTRTLPYDGNFVDARVSSTGGGTYPFKKRPRLIRVLVDMTEPVTKVSQSFSFSFQPPGLLPTSTPAGSIIP